MISRKEAYCYSHINYFHALVLSSFQCVRANSVRVRSIDSVSVCLCVCPSQDHPSVTKVIRLLLRTVLLLLLLLLPRLLLLLPPLLTVYGRRLPDEPPPAPQVSDAGAVDQVLLEVALSLLAAADVDVAAAAVVVEVAADGDARGLNVSVGGGFV